MYSICSLLWCNDLINDYNKNVEKLFLLNLLVSDGSIGYMAALISSWIVQMEAASKLSKTTWTSAAGAKSLAIMNTSNSGGEIIAIC